MLPELLFSVGNSMQDLSREEYGLLNGGCEKDTIIASESSLERIKLGRTPELEPTSSSVSVKLEDPVDVFPWHTTSTNIGSNLLRHSDDPLISGAIDDNQNEFNPITNCDQLPISPKPIAATSTTTAPKTRKKVPRTRKKSTFKLRFHHQALPQEYLDHYEATQNNIQIKNAALAKANAAKSSNKSAESISQHEQQQQHTNESVRNWLQKISEFQSDRKSGAAATSSSLSNDNRKSSVPSQATASSITTTVTSASPATNTNDNGNRPQTRVVSYNDLPYMGEMTLENSKPRRGRKPKKADICHLIYKNYGTILPGTPSKIAAETNNNQKSATPLILAKTATPTPIDGDKSSSLLEKRLTQDSNCTLSVLPSTPKSNQNDDDMPKPRKEEPLNLCVRDRSDTMTVSSCDDHCDDDDTESLFGSNRSTPIISQSDISSDTILAANLKMALPNFHSALLDNKKRPASSDTPSTTTTSGGGDAASPNSGYMYWPNAGVFIHPMALYYQKMLDGTISNASTATSIPITDDNLIADASPISSPSPPGAKNGNTDTKLLVPKNISQLLKQKKISSPSSMVEKSSFSVPKIPPDALLLPSKSTSQSSQIKRKRSAIFIPPMPNETSSNHATEVSICKFKFTGGAKPSLQEKKMLSVDAGGNFRYYSGTGDKSIRGYEFFPRESLHQASLTTNSSAGAFLNTPGKRIPVDQTLPSHGLSNELLQIPELTTAGVVGVMSPIASLQSNNNNMSNWRQKLQSRTKLNAANADVDVEHAPQPIFINQHHPSRNDRHASDRRKRKSRRSLHREKLEKTFKEKGFLIQTQQLESAEGATYCKFRQLRKFTRYLFRSWKDYLPGDLQQGNQMNSALQQAAAAGVLADLDPQQLQAATASLNAESLDDD